MIAAKLTKMKTALSISGSDSSGGAGVQADIKTMTMNGVYAMSAITALTAQNTCRVRMIEEVSPDILKAQLAAVFQDIFPDAVKIGMVGSSALISVIAASLKHYGAKNIVLDPVMISTSGHRLMREEALSCMIKELFPLADLITPNIAEAEFLSASVIKNDEDMVRVAKSLSETYSCSVLLKGGHHNEHSNDILVGPRGIRYYCSERINNPNTHGTGCTLSSAIAANLAKGYPLEDSIARAKDYVSQAILAGLDLGRGLGPLKHNFDLKSSFAK